MSATKRMSREKVSDVPRRGPIKPEGFTEDPVERARIVEELHGSCPDIMTQEELRRMREES
jgi:hypothetical protein